MKAGNDSAPDTLISPSSPVYQLASLVEVPAAARILRVGAYFRSVSGFGFLDYRICVWQWGGSLGAAHPLLGRTAVRTTSPAASELENLQRQTGDLEDPVELPDPFTSVLVGIAWETDPDRLANVGGHASGTRYKRELPDGAGWPQSMSGAAVSTPAHALAAWIEDYEPIAGIFVVRSGEWVQLLAGDSLMVRRSGVWGGHAPVKVRRSGAWVNVPY